MSISKYDKEFGSGAELWQVDLTKFTRKSKPPISQVSREFVVDRIVGFDHEDGMYLVRWEGYKSEDDTWEELSSFKGGLRHSAVVRFWSRMKLGPPRLEEFATQDTDITHVCPSNCDCRK